MWEGHNEGLKGEGEEGGPGDKARIVPLTCFALCCSRGKPALPGVPVYRPPRVEDGGGGGVSGDEVQPGEETPPTFIQLTHPYLFPSLNASPRTPRTFLIHFFITSQPSPVIGVGPCLVKVCW